MAKIVILGAGLTGISTAYHLEKKGFFDYKLFERDATVGGLCRTVTQDGFTFDYTGHLLHINDGYFQSLINTVVGLGNFESVHRRSYIFSHEVYTHYPFQVNLFGLPPEVIAECIEGFITRKKTKSKGSFYEWALSYFGKGIARHFFFSYQKKIFAYDIKKITASWTGRFVPSTSLTQMIQGALTNPSHQDNVGYNAHFYYPKQGGIFFWVDKIAQTLLNPIYNGYEVASVDVQAKTVVFSNGEVEKYETLISTIPLDCLLGRLKEKSSSFLKDQSKHLLCNSVLNFNLGINRPDVSDKHWIYFPESKFPFYRIGFPHNFARATVPQGCSSLYGEFSYIKKSDRYKAKALTTSLEATKKLLHISNSDIITQVVIDIPYAYVIYDFWREKNLARLLSQLSSERIYSIGRYGAWKYSSMQEAVLDGKNVVDEIFKTSEQKELFVSMPEYTSRKELG